MRLSRVDGRRIAALREERRRDTALGIVPVFYGRLAGEAESYLLEDPGESGPSSAMGYVLSLERPHDGHTHVTVIELQVDPLHRHRYEDVLDLVRDELHPTAYLTRTDDCLYNATLLSRGLQVEPTALVMQWREGSPAPVEPGRQSMAMEELAQTHMDGIRGLLDTDKDAEALAQLEALMGSSRAWAVLDEGSPVAVVARQDGGDGRHELLDFALARATESYLAQALRRAAEVVEGEGLVPAAVIDALETARRRIFREAGFHTQAAYLVYYDPVTGRPSVPTVTTEELRRLVDDKQPVRIVDALGEEHWKEGHIPGSEWIEFKGLAREARKRFRPDEPIIVYCSGHT